MMWRILIVDDEPDIRLIIRTTLEPKYEVLEAHDGLDALEKIERYEPDFVLMDVMMPLMNGFEACAAIRKSPRFHDLPVMFLSALGSRDDMMKGYSAGANLYLTKPFDPARLLKNLEVFFEKTPPQRRPRRYSIEQIREAEKQGKSPVAPGANAFEPVGPP
ncbi:MAG TPA: response regulator, partial [Salinarimonas sp.]|nr:response regulator [Salinarimonas sp.]